MIIISTILTIISFVTDLALIALSLSLPPLLPLFEFTIADDINDDVIRNDIP